MSLVAYLKNKNVKFCFTSCSSIIITIIKNSSSNNKHVCGGTVAPLQYHLGARRQDGGRGGREMTDTFWAFLLAALLYVLLLLFCAVATTSCSQFFHLFLFHHTALQQTIKNKRSDEDHHDILSSYYCQSEEPTSRCKCDGIIDVLLVVVLHDA